MALVVLLYYFIVSSELKMALRFVEETLMRVEEKFEDVEKKFERVKQSFDEDIHVLKREVGELKELLKKPNNKKT